MCEVCGCGDTTKVTVQVHQGLMSRNDAVASRLRARFAASGCLALNLMGSPGAGKTALIEATARAWPSRRMAAVSGDLATALDAERLTRAGVVAAPITTGTVCHLEASMLSRALEEPILASALGEAGIFFIENVGNLVCPAIYDLGQAANVVVLSATEGVDKPLKYPVMFQRADLVVLTRADLLPYLPDVSVDAVRDALARVNPRPRLLPLSSRTGEGLEPWLAWLEERAGGPPVRV